MDLCILLVLLFKYYKKTYSISLFSRPIFMTVDV